MNEGFFKTIEPVLHKLEEMIGDDFIVFGSAPLYLLGVVEFGGMINDLDIAVKDTSVIPKDAKEVRFYGKENQKLYKLKIDDIEVDIGGAWPGREAFLKKIFTDPVIYEGFRFANLGVVEEWKEEMVRKYDRRKDKDYLEKIGEFKKKKS